MLLPSPPTDPDAPISRIKCGAPHFRAEPAAGGNVGKAPSEVTLHFSERLEGVLSSVVVRDAAGKQVDKDNGSVDKKTVGSFGFRCRIWGLAFIKSSGERYPPTRTE
jgi:hypothetical protein